jgi:hypothetical protein
MSNRIKAHVWWSIYVQTSNMRKLRQAHLPPIEDALETIEFDWQVLIEEGSPGLFRLITYQNFEIENVSDIVVPVLRRAYRLADGWTIMGLDDLSTGRLQHVYGSCAKPARSNKPPALESIIFEIEPGRILPMNADGGWKVGDSFHEQVKLKATQIRRPEKSHGAE